MDKDDEVIDLSAIVSTIHEHIDTRLVEDGLAEGTEGHDETKPSGDPASEGEEWFDSFLGDIGR